MFCLHLPKALSQAQCQILLDGLAQQYAQLKTWPDFVDACTEHPDWIPSRGPIGQALENTELKVKVTPSN